MGSLVLLNDVHTLLDDEGVIVGNLETEASKIGLEQSVTIGKNVQPHLGKVHYIYSSDCPSLSRLLHQIRSKSDNAKLAKIDIKYTDSLKERNFGVLNGSNYSLDSDLFRNTRICAENGESIAQCRKRMIDFLKQICSKDKHILCISHPFSCQISVNALLNKDHTILSKFWLKKGSMVSFNVTEDKFGLIWSFKRAYNALDDSRYSVDEIYQEVL